PHVYIQSSDSHRAVHSFPTRRSSDLLHEHIDLTVRDGQRHLAIHQGEGIGDERFLDALGDRTGEHFATSVENRHGTGVRSGQDGQLSAVLLFGEDPLQGLRRLCHHFSTNTWMVPPQASPTSNASSSDIP